MAIDRDGDGPPLRRDEPRTAKAADGLRVSPFTEDVFDDEYYGRRPRRTGGISFGVVAGVVFFAAVVAAAGWYLLAERSSTSTVAGEGAIVRADPEPYKVKPEDPGGLQVANQDKLIYDDRMAKGPAPKHAENLLPAPEEPRAPPVKAAPEPRPAPSEPKAAAAPEPKPEAKAEAPAAKASQDPMADLMAKVEGMKKPEEADEAPPPPPPVAKAPTAIAAAPPSAMASPVAPATAPTSPPPAASAPAASPMLLVPAAETHPADAPAPEKPPTVVANAAPSTPVAQSMPSTAAAPAVGAAAPGDVPGAVYVQLASARSEDGAMSEWKRISTKNADLLTGLSPTVAQAEVPDKGTFFRLRAGPVSDRTTAQNLCGSLIARGLTCLIVRP